MTEDSYSERLPDDRASWISACDAELVNRGPGIALIYDKGGRSTRLQPGERKNFVGPVSGRAIGEVTDVSVTILDEDE